MVGLLHVSRVLTRQIEVGVHPFLILQSVAAGLKHLARHRLVAESDE
jgi:hypothetical protein